MKKCQKDNEKGSVTRAAKIHLITMAVRSELEESPCSILWRMHSGVSVHGNGRKDMKIDFAFKSY